MISIKKITSAILIMTLALCLFGCGEKGEPKLSTVEEISAELDNMIDYEAFGLEKVKDEFDEAYAVSKTQENINGELNKYLDIIKKEFEGCNYEPFTKDIISKNCAVLNEIVFGEVLDELKNTNATCESFITQRMTIYFYHKYGVLTTDGVKISDGENTINIPKDFFGMEENDPTYDTISMLLPCTEENLKSFENIVKSENNLKIRIQEDSQYSSIRISDLEMTKEQSDEFRQMLKWYLELKDKCNQDKVAFPV